MDKRLVQHWIDQLRSGDWRQGRYALCTNYDDDEFRYCCLGVLNEITGNDARNSRFWGTPVLAYRDGDSWSEGLNYNYLSELGLPHQLIVDLQRLNDHGVPFDMIADYLEKELL